MGTYNTLNATLPCPRCGALVDTDIECHFGYTAEMKSLRMGDCYPSGKATSPEAPDGDSYMECPLCGKDSHLLVQVDDGIIIGVAPNPHKTPYVD
jgi:endogenous inhibitor of DNA gyrase (YacG/DUF329 family)